MSKPHKTLLSDISDRAISTFGEYTIERQGEFEKHWLATAEKMKEEFVSEGLVETAAAIEAHISWTRQYVESHRSEANG